MYGTVDAIKHANAAHARYIPFPISTSMPTGTMFPGWPTMTVLMLCAFLTMTVQMTAPMSRNALPMIARAVAAR